MLLRLVSEAFQLCLGISASCCCHCEMGLLGAGYKLWEGLLGESVLANSLPASLSLQNRSCSPTLNGFLSLSFSPSFFAFLPSLFLSTSLFSSYGSLPETQLRCVPAGGADASGKNECQSRSVGNKRRCECPVEV